MKLSSFKTSVLVTTAVTLLFLGSCEQEKQKDAKEGQIVSISLGYTLSTDKGQSMETNSSSPEIFDEFYQKILSGELAAQTYHLTFTEKTTGAVYTADGTWAGKETITLRTGTYTVTGTSTATGENVQDKCSLKFNDEVFVDITTKTITLKADYDCSLIIFSDSTITRMINFNGIDSTDLFKFNTYIYTFVHTKLWADGKQSSAFLEGIHANDTRFKIFTGTLDFEIGKYYIYGNVRTLMFSLAKMEEGGAEGYPTDLSKDGTANCYIVPVAGAYKFNAAVIGNGHSGIIPDANFHTTTASITPERADIIWDDNSIISSISFLNGEIYFSTTGKLGNALIAAKNSSGETLWSWHIWATDTPSSAAGPSGVQIMDRNLGAVSAKKEDREKTFGLYYQWGRKDPFHYTDLTKTTCSSETGTITYSVAHPDTQILADDRADWLYIGNQSNELWGYTSQKKTIYDPCPQGYKVMYETGFTLSNTTYNSTYNGRSYGSLWFPFASRLEDPGFISALYFVNSDCSGLNCCYDLVLSSNSILPHNLDYKIARQSVRCQKE